MPCPLFVGGPRCQCAAVVGGVIPSLHERERYCLSDRHDACRTLRARVAAGAPLPEETWWALWTDPPPAPAVQPVHAATTGV